MSSNPYLKFVSEYARLINEGTDLQLGGFPSKPRSTLSKEAPRALVFSPHPDDECIVGALPLRLLRELKMNVINVAVTLGSRKDRQMERLNELRGACEYLGFGLIQTAATGLEKINPKSREQTPELWGKSVQIAAKIINDNQPQVIFVPHENDWNSTHVGTQLLVADALRTLPESFCCWICHTEFWAPMNNPNLMVEVSVADLADTLAALSFHVGEVRRNPYHLRLPPWMQDNVRRGGELVGGQGGAAPEFVFAVLYRLQKWNRRKLEAAREKGRFVSCNDSLSLIFG
ncbi:MAG: PIG-L family deacetylase [Kiritimatiellae bacterium]|nr:PIG-L family deacetylase [Kiritimatiellia bacterium]